MKAFATLGNSLLVIMLLALAPLGVASAQQIKVTSATPASTYQGTVSLDVVIAGSGFDSTSKAQFFVAGSTNPGGVTVRKTVFHNSKEVVATIDVTDTAVVSSYDVVIMLNDGRKGKGTTLFAVQKKVAVVDPCSSASPDYAVNWAGFPAYAFVRDTTSGSTASYEIRVASRNGVCSKRVGDVQPRGPYNLSFARSADPALPYIIAWVGSGIGIQIARFTLDGASETTIPANVALFRSNAYSPDLSTDGTSLAYTTSSAQYLWNLRIASLADSDTTGAGDTTLLSYENRDVTSLTWAPWGRIYYKTLDLTNGRQLMGIDPALPPGSQASESLLQLPANAPLQVSVLFDFGRFTSGYVGYDAAGPVPQLVFQGYYTTGLKGPGKSSGTSCAAVYSLHAVSHAFLIGSVTSPSPITGFSPSVTRDATALYEQSTAPSSGSTCNRTGYVGESALASGYTTSISNGVAGSWPAALKNP